MASGIGLLSVNVALPEVMPVRHRGHPVRSAIAKRPVAGDSLLLGTCNLAGDAQADLSVHGGPDKAVYAYSADLWPAWERDLGRRVGPAAFGENLTVTGATEADVCVGDRWVWGDAEMEVCQPRTPCYKLTLHAGTADVGRIMRRTGRCGWYLRVISGGQVPTTGEITVRPHPARVSILDAVTATRGEDRAAVERALAVDALADEWRTLLGEVLQAISDR